MPFDKIPIPAYFSKSLKLILDRYAKNPKTLLLNFVFLSITIIVICLVVLDRISWASISQWREDQSVNIWLGYTQPINQIPVGLVNSQGMPNPNGMILLGVLISRLPGLWFISSFLGIIQALLLTFLSWCWFGKTKLFIFTSCILLSSAVLRAISIEFWNQWILLYLDIFFFLILANDIQKPNLPKLPLIIFSIVFTPSLYLGGLANVIAFILLIAILWIKYRFSLRTSRLFVQLFLSFMIVVFFLVITWIPFFKAIQLSNLITYMSGSTGSIFRQLAIALMVLMGFLGWSITWILRLIPSVLFFDGNILPPSAIHLINLHNFILIYQTIMGFITFGFASLTSMKSDKNFSKIFLQQYQKQGQFILLGYAFILLTFTVNALLKGPFWINGERVDMTLQFLPFFLIIWFVTPSIVHVPPGFHKVVNITSGFLAIVFVVVNIALGELTIQSIRNYRGNILTPSDVPLYEKLEMIKFVAKDWSSRSNSKEIPIYYDFDAAIPANQKGRYGIELTPWYPSPYTLGRAFDYELLRVYQLHNSQEGKPGSQRSKDLAVYIIHYSLIPSVYSNNCYNNYSTGRLSVSILKTGGHDCSN